MAKTWPIECDDAMLEMLAFCMGTMAALLKEDIANGGGCGCGDKQLSVRQLRADLKTANRILAAAYKGQVNLAVKKEVTRKKRGGK